MSLRRCFADKKAAVEKAQKKVLILHFPSSHGIKFYQLYELKANESCKKEGNDKDGN